MLEFTKHVYCIIPLAGNMAKNETPAWTNVDKAGTIDITDI